MLSRAISPITGAATVRLSRRAWQRLANESPSTAFGSRLLATQLVQQGLIHVLFEVLRIVCHEDRDTAIREVAIMLERQLPPDTPQRDAQRLAHRTQFEQLHHGLKR